MDRLREVVEAAGLEQVETFIASGNVIFRSQAELESITSFEPSDPPAADPSVYVLLFPMVAAEVRRRLEGFSTDTDKFEFAGREVFWVMDGKLSESPLFGMDLTKVTGGAMTMRNMTTLRRLVAKYATS